MRRRRDFWDQAGEQMGLSGNSGRGAGIRSPGRGTRYWSPSDALQSQPFHGFPGGRLAWERFKMTGELPGAAQGLSKEAQSHYYNRIPQQTVEESLAMTDPVTGGLLEGANLKYAPDLRFETDSGPEGTAYSRHQQVGGLADQMQSTAMPSNPQGNAYSRHSQVGGMAGQMGSVGDPLARVLFGLR